MKDCNCTSTCHNTKFFIADDKYQDVINILEKEFKWQRITQHSFPFYNLKWTNYCNIQWSKVKSMNLVNHIQNSIIFSRKDLLAKALYEYQRISSSTLGSSNSVDQFYPRTFNLSTVNGLYQFKYWYLYSRAVKVLKHYHNNKATEVIDLKKLQETIALLRIIFKHSPLLSEVDKSQTIEKGTASMSYSLSIDSAIVQAIEECEWTALQGENLVASSHSKNNLHVDKTELNNIFQIVKVCDTQYSLLDDSTASVWILKPSNLSLGRGITLETSLEEIIDRINVKERSLSTSVKQSSISEQPQTGMESLETQKWIIQKYIERPLLLQGGRKFDIRQWVLLSVTEKPEKNRGSNLQVYWYNKCYLRFCNHKYALSSESRRDHFAHLSNYSIQKDITPTVESDDGDVKYESMWSSDRIQQVLREQSGGKDIWSSSIVPQMKNAALTAIKAVVPSLKTTSGGFEWLGFDFLLDDNYHIWLLEINLSPDMSHSTSVTTELVPQATQDALHILLDKLTNQSPISTKNLTWEELLL